jgi:hypothetical protein
MAVRYSEYLVTLPVAVQRGLTNDLTLGCGRVAYADRLHRRDPRSVAMLGQLGAAHACLRDARAALDPTGGWTEGPPGPAGVLAQSEDLLPARWAALVAAAEPTTVAAWLAMAAEMAGDVTALVAADGPVAMLAALLEQLLDALAVVRDDTLAPP